MNGNSIKTLSTNIAQDIQYRASVLADFDDLVGIEKQCFERDRLSARQLKHWLKAPHKVMLVALLNGQIVAYGLVIMRKGTSLARLYSLAVLPKARGLGMAVSLLSQLESLSVQKNMLFMRLEVAVNNTAAINLYRSLGYKDFGFYAEYYEDKSDALRMQKSIAQNAVSKELAPYPYYQQTTEFSCGPASLLMAMAKLNKNIKLNQSLELDIWRTATTIFMTSGHGGTHPIGLALAAAEYGFTPHVYINQRVPLFLAGVRNEHKKSIVAEVEKEFLRKAMDKFLPIHYQDFSIDLIKRSLRQGHSVICLISSYQFDGYKGPHWVSITHIDDHFLYIHDPEPTSQVMERQHVPISLDKFVQYTCYGKAKLRTAIVLCK